MNNRAALLSEKAYFVRLCMEGESCLKSQKKKRTVCQKRCLLCLQAVLLACVLFLSGCSKMTQADIQFTTGLGEHELFKIGHEVCTQQQAAVLLASQRNSYEAVYGDGIWKIPVGGRDFEGVVLDSMKALLAQMKCMVLMAEEYEVTLPEAEKRRIREAAAEFCQSADTKELADAGVTEDDVYQVFYEYRLSNQLIDELTRNVDIEISDNDARIIQVQQIFFSTVDAEGNSVSQEEKETKYERMTAIRQRIDSGEEFGKLAEIYDTSQQTHFSIGRGEMPQVYEDIVFALEDGEVSDIIETDAGFYLVKCLEDYDIDATQVHKEQMGAVKKKDAFSQLYDTFTAGLTSEFNQSAWEQLSMSGEGKITGADFFRIYRNYFEAQ
ncbi:MAG: hypothetical protein HFI89_09015 [Lachnospiraceae bacterium]|nr:hypothetical protein [Lachnospiraceae bacterium]